MPIFGMAYFGHMVCIATQNYVIIAAYAWLIYTNFMILKHRDIMKFQKHFFFFLVLFLTMHCKAMEDDKQSKALETLNNPQDFINQLYEGWGISQFLDQLSPADTSKAAAILARSSYWKNTNQQPPSLDLGRIGLQTIGWSADGTSMVTHTRSPDTNANLISRWDINGLADQHEKFFYRDNLATENGTAPNSSADETVKDIAHLNNVQNIAPWR
jgi:hypothetical protein